MKKIFTVLIAAFLTLTTTHLASADEPTKTRKEMVEEKAKNPDEYKLLLQLKDGVVEIELLPMVAPKTVTRIKELAHKGFYDGIIFHRVIDGFMAQTGDPTGTGMGGSGKKLPDETSSLRYNRGVVAMANAGPNTSDSQFFIMFRDYPLPSDYTIFGKVTKGMEFVDKIAKGEPPRNPDKIISMKVKADVKKAGAKPAAGKATKKAPAKKAAK